MTKRSQLQDTDHKVASLGLKNQTEPELLQTLLSVADWSQPQKDYIMASYELGRNVHAHDTHRGDPYITHCLRVAARVAGYLRVHDEEVVAAAILHDSVEDHPDYIVDHLQHSPTSSNVCCGLTGRECQALERMSERFSSRTARIVALATNPPQLNRPDAGLEQKLAAYSDKVEQATRSPEGWMVKFSDWCDNGVGVIYGEHLISTDRSRYFRTKYGHVLDVFKRRFECSDLQQLLDTEAKVYVRQQLRLARRRLITS